MIRRTLFVCGAVLLMLTGILWTARQSEPLSAGRAFVTDFGDGLHVYRRWRDGSGVRRLTRASDGMASGGRVAWSPDGRWLAYLDEGLNLVRADGSMAIRLTDSFDTALSWSAASDAIAFQSFRERNWDIYIIHLQDDRAPRRLTSHAAPDTAPTWSPDGAWIAFASEREGNSDIFRVHPDGSNLQNLTHSGLSNEFAPVWSRDGLWIHYELRTDRFERMHSDGSNIRRAQGDTRDVIIPSRIPLVDLRPRFPALVAAGVLTLFASGIISRWPRFSRGT